MSKKDKNKKTKPYFNLRGIDQNILFDKILTVIDNGCTTTQLRQNPFKYLVSGKTKEIVINAGASGLLVSLEILKEMAKRGDENAIDIINYKRLRKIDDWGIPKEDQNNEDRTKYGKLYRDSNEDNEDEDFYDRENKILIEILKEGKLKNIGGWALCVHKVYIEPWSYEIIHEDDMYGSESIKGSIF